MKKAISVLLTAIMVFTLVPMLFVRDGQAAGDEYVKNTSSGVVNVHKDAGDASDVVDTLAPGQVAKIDSETSLFYKIVNPSGYVKKTDVEKKTITLKAEGGRFVYDGSEHKVKATLTNGEGFVVEYSTDSGKSWTTTAPSLKEVGKLTVKVRACKDSVILTHKDVTLEITKTPPEGTEVTIVEHAGLKTAPVRTAANASSSKIGTAKEGEKYSMISREGSWYKIKFGSKEGYVYYWYIKVGAYSTETDVEPDPTHAKLTAKGGTFLYDGKEHKVVATLENGAGYTIEYSTDNGKTWTTKAPGLTQVGTLTVKVRATGGSSKLTHKDVVIEVLESVPAGTKVTIIAHNGTDKAPVRTGSGAGTTKIGTATAGEKYELLGQVGSWYKINFGGTPGFVYYWFVTQDALPDPAVPDPAPETEPSSSAKLTVKGGTFMYDGAEHKVVATLENGAGLTVEFSTDGGKTWTTKAPGLTEPGKLTVKARATGGSKVIKHSDVTLTVTKAAPAGTAITIVAHGSQNKAPVRSGPANNATKVGSLDAGTHGTIVSQSGSWIKVKCGSVEGYVYEWFVKIGTLPPEETESTEASDPSKVKLSATGGVFIYDGKEHKVTAKLENATGYKIEYSTDGGKKWSSTAPSLTQVGKLTVKVRATGGGNIINHADVKLQVIEGIPSGTDITIIAHGSQNVAPVRAAAANSAEKVGSLNAGETGKLIKQEGSWYKVKVGEVEGYVYNWFVQVGTITVDD